MDGEVFNTLKGLASWASSIALALIAWAWKLNAEEHKELRRQIKEASDKAKAHTDEQIKDLREYSIQEDMKLMSEVTIARSNIAKLFDKLEAHSQRSEDRHVEMLRAMHSK